MPARNIVIGQTVNPTKLEWAKQLRKNMTDAEKILWQALRANRLYGFHFRRQQIIGGYIVDFYCHKARLVVELDGGIHAGQEEYDRERTELIRDYDLEVIRFKNEIVIEGLAQTLQEIARLCRERTSSPSLHGKGQGDR